MRCWHKLIAFLITATASIACQNEPSPKEETTSSSDPCECTDEPCDENCEPLFCDEGRAHCGTDEGCGTDILFDRENCGSCGNYCGYIDEGGTYPSGQGGQGGQSSGHVVELSEVGYCHMGVCCREGFEDLDGDLSNGCEALVWKPVEAPYPCPVTTPLDRGHDPLDGFGFYCLERELGTICRYENLLENREETWECQTFGSARYWRRVDP